jgi:hypothetical protein
MKSGSYQITPHQDGLLLTLSSQYTLYGLIGVFLRIPVRLVLELFQRYLLQGIKANAERRPFGNLDGEADA